MYGNFEREGDIKSFINDWLSLISECLRVLRDRYPNG